jgi:hypothetical protein
MLRKKTSVAFAHHRACCRVAGHLLRAVDFMRKAGDPSPTVWLASPHSMPVAQLLPRVRDAESLPTSHHALARGRPPWSFENEEQTDSIGFGRRDGCQYRLL